MNPKDARVKQSSSVGVPPAELTRSISRVPSRRKWPWVAVFVLVAGLTVFVSGQQRGQIANPQSSMSVPILTSGPQPDSLELPGLPTDWSFHHLTFTDPGTEEDAINAGRQEEWLRVVNEPRYIIQQLKRRQPAQGPWADEVAKLNAKAQAQGDSGGAEPIIFRAGQLEAAPRPVKGHRPLRPVKAGIDRDWSMDLGAGAAATGIGTVTTNNATGTSTFSVGGYTFTGNAPTAASQTATVSGLPTSSQESVSLTLAPNTVNLSTNATGGSSWQCLAGRG